MSTVKTKDGTQIFYKGWADRAFVLEALLVGVAAVTAAGIRSSLVTNPRQLYGVIAATGLAIGLRNAIVRELAVPDLTTAVLTLTITGLVSGDNRRWQRRVVAV